jgi:hypothetical protein
MHLVCLDVCVYGEVCVCERERGWVYACMYTQTDRQTDTHTCTI